jgi:hypothetical protein
MDHEAEPDTDGAEAGTAEVSEAEDSTAEAGVAEAGASEAGAAEAGAAARIETGEPRVDAALRLLGRLSELPVTEHAAVFEQVQAELTAVLGQLDPESAGADN